MSGGGFLPRQRLERAHEAFLTVRMSSWSFRTERMLMSGSMTPRERTISLYSALSPAMLPRAQMAWCGERERERKRGGGGRERRKKWTQFVWEGVVITLYHTTCWLTCSRTYSCGERSSCMREGMAPASMTALVWRVEPDAIFVNTHAASNYSITINIAVRRDTFGGRGRDKLRSLPAALPWRSLQGTGQVLGGIRG